MKHLSMFAVALIVTACSSSGPSGKPTPSTAVVTPSPVSSPSVAPVGTGGPGALRLVVLGDSIAIPKMGCGECVGFDRQYAAFLETQTARPVDLQNEARPNATIDDLRSVLSTNSVVQAEVAVADIVIVSIGYNNTPPWAPDLPCHTPEAQKDADIWAGILAMTPSCIDEGVALFAHQLAAVYGRIEELAAGRPQVRISLGVFNNLKDNPGGDGTLLSVDHLVMAAAYPIYELAIGKWNTADCSAATAHGFVCADLYHAFNGPDGRGSLKDLVNPKDFVHPNVAGQARIFELLKAIDISI